MIEILKILNWITTIIALCSCGVAIYITCHNRKIIKEIEESKPANLEEKLYLNNSISETRFLFGPYHDHHVSWIEVENHLNDYFNTPLHTYQGVYRGMQRGNPEHWVWVKDPDGIWRVYIRDDANGVLADRYAICVDLKKPIFPDSNDAAIYELCKN